MATLAETPVGTVLPHRAPTALDVDTITRVAQRAEALGFSDLWVTENTVDRAHSYEPMLLLTHAAAVTTRIRLGVSVMVLPVRHPIHVAHACATLDQLSAGRFTLGIGIGRDHHYSEFGVAPERRVARFNEALAILRALWTEPCVTHDGDFYTLRDITMPLKPVQARLPVWIGAAHANAVRRAARLADGWMGAGSQPMAAFENSLGVLHAALTEFGVDHSTYPVSKRLFMTIDDNMQRAHDRLASWFAAVYGDASLVDTAGVFGPVDAVRAQLEQLVEKGVNHLLLNPIDEFEEQLELVAKMLGRSD